MPLGTLHFFDSLDARLRMDPGIEFARQVAEQLLPQLGIPMPAGGFRRSIRSSQRASERWIPAMFLYKKQEVLLGERFDPSSQQHVYTLLHELAHHVDRSRRGTFTHRYRDTHHAESFSRALADLLIAYGVKFTGPCEYKMVKQDLTQMLRGTNLLPKFQGENFCTVIDHVPMQTKEVVAAVKRETMPQPRKGRLLFKDESGDIKEAFVLYEIKKQKIPHYYVREEGKKPFMISSQDERFVRIHWI